MYYNIIILASYLAAIWTTDISDMAHRSGREVTDAILKSTILCAY